MCLEINDFVVSGVVVEWLGERISERVIPGSSPVSRHSGFSFPKKMSISHDPYQARSALN